MSARACQPLLLEACLQFVAAKVLQLAIELSKRPGDKCLAVDHFVDEFAGEKDVCSALSDAGATKNIFINSVIQLWNRSMTSGEGEELSEAPSKFGKT